LNVLTISKYFHFINTKKSKCRYVNKITEHLNENVVGSKPAVDNDNISCIQLLAEAVKEKFVAI